MSKERKPIVGTITFGPTIDYRALLLKFIGHVVGQGGRGFLDFAARVDYKMQRPARERVTFSDAEWAELQRLAEEAGRG